MYSNKITLRYLYKMILGKYNTYSEKEIVNWSTDDEMIFKKEENAKSNILQVYINEKFWIILIIV